MNFLGIYNLFIFIGCVESVKWYLLRGKKNWNFFLGINGFIVVLELSFIIVEIKELDKIEEELEMLIFDV